MPALHGQLTGDPDAGIGSPPLSGLALLMASSRSDKEEHGSRSHLNRRKQIKSCRFPLANRTAILRQSGAIGSLARAPDVWYNQGVRIGGIG